MSLPTTAPRRGLAPRRSLGSAVAALGSLLALAVAPSPVAAAAAEPAAPRLQVHVTPGPQGPHEIPLRTDPPEYPQARTVVLRLSADAPATGVHVTATPDTGLLVDGDTAPRVVEVGTVAARERIVRLRVAGAVGGLHRLAVSINGDGLDEQRRSLLLWAPGGPPLPGGDSLAGLLLAANGRAVETYQIESELSYRFSTRLCFVDDRFARFDSRPVGRCSARTPRCHRYHYDGGTGLLQVGNGTVGRVTTRSAFLDGRGQQFFRAPRPGARLAGTWRFSTQVDDARGVRSQRLQLRRDGTYTLRLAIAGVDPFYAFASASTGRYTVLQHGRLRLLDRRGGRREARLALQWRAGRARPAARGAVVLDVPVRPRRQQAFVDGNVLHPVG